MMEEDRMRLAGVRTPQQDDSRLFDLGVRTCAAAHSKYRRQTDDARDVSSAVATVDIVSPDRRADELLRRVVQLVGGLGAAEHPESIRAVLPDLCPKAFGHAVQR